MWAGHICPQGSRPPVALHISPSFLNILLAGAALEELGEKSRRKRQERRENQSKWDDTSEAWGLLERT